MLVLQQSLENQINLARDLKRYLLEFQERLSHTAQSYQHKCGALYEAGMMEETHQKFEQEYAQPTIRLIVQVVEQINSFDVRFVEKYIDKIEQSVPVIRDIYSNIVVRRYGNRILDNYGNWIYEIRGDRIYDTSGNWKYEIRGDRIYDTSGNWLAYES